MYKKDAGFEQIYSEIMEAMKLLNREFLEYKQDLSKASGINNLLVNIKKKDFKSIKQFFVRNYRRKKIIHYQLQKTSKKQEIYKKSNYFSKEKFVVYTVIFGKYDRLYEPYFVPDNCEFIIITDMDIPQNSKWKKFDLKKLYPVLNGLNNVEKNRILKMKPQILFPEYRYSVYIDGNVQAVTDLTEIIHKIPDCGIALHFHNHRDCVYEEAKVLALLKREDPLKLQDQAEHMSKEKMPQKYGLLECNVIAREHNKEICRKVMDDWWDEFQAYSKRDQLSFPYVLYKNGIQVQEVARLGTDVRANFAFRVHEHSNG